MIVVLNSNVDLKVVRKSEIKILDKKNIKKNNKKISWFFNSK